MESKLRTTWKVRAMPALAAATGPWPEMRMPSSRTSPLSGVTAPEMELKRLLLPAPLGPMRPRISPGWTSKLMSTLAATPPKDLLTFLIRRMGSGIDFFIRGYLSAGLAADAEEAD